MTFRDPDTSLPNRRAIPSLDGLRAISILLVVIAHARPSFPAAFRDWSILNYVANSSLGVTTFFVISGFLITSLLLKELESTCSISLLRFYFRRALRIFVPFYVYLGALAVLWAARTITQHTPSFVAAATYTWNYTLSARGWFLAHSWSLSVEEQFYLIWPAVLLLLRRKRAVWFAAGCIVASPILRVLTYFLAPRWRNHIGMMLHTRMDVLMAGALIALLWNNSRFHRVLDRVCRPWAGIAIALVVLVVSPLMTHRFAGAFQLPIGFSVDAIGIALLLAYCVKCPGTLAGRFLNWHPVMRVGIMSYSLYLWQQLFLGESFGHFPVNVTCAFLAAGISYHWVERPSLRLRVWLEARWDARRPMPERAHAAAGAQ